MSEEEQRPSQYGDMLAKQWTKEVVEASQKQEKLNQLSSDYSFPGTNVVTPASPKAIPSNEGNLR